LLRLGNDSRSKTLWLLTAAWLVNADVPPPLCELTLTTAAPRGACELPEARPLIVRIPVRPLRIPNAGAVNVRVELLLAGGPLIPLQSLSLFPITTPSTFAVRLPPFSGAARIAFTLFGGTSPVSVAVGPVSYLYEEPH
jgi:hypothetical protein